MLGVTSFSLFHLFLSTMNAKKGHERIWTRHDATLFFLASPRLRMSSPIFLASETLKAQVASQQHNFWWCDLFSMKWRSPKVLVEKLYAAKASAKKKCVFFVSCPKSRNKMRSDLRNKVMTYNIRVRLTPINVISSPEIRDNGCE